MQTQSVEVVRVKRGVSGVVRKRPAQPLHLVKILTRGHQYLRKCTQKEAWRLIKSGRAKEHTDAKGRERLPRLKTIIDLSAGAELKVPIGSLKTTYEEPLGDTRSLITSKRVQAGDKKYGDSFVAWDQGLTFKELRAGQFVSAETKVRREIARQDRAFSKKR
jgi:hypothetical protein